MTDRHLPAGFDDLDPARLHARHSMKWRAHPSDVIPAWVAEMDFPVAVCVTAAVEQSLARGGDFGYAVDLFSAPLAEAFTGFARRRFDWVVDPGRVLLLRDVMRGVELWIDGFTRPGDGVVVSSPVYYPFLDAVRQSGRELVEAPMVRSGSGWELDLDALAAAFRAGNRLYLLCNPHNPTGRAFTMRELGALAALTERYDVRVVADEIHAPLVYPPTRHVPFASVDESTAARTLTLHAATKAWNFAGLHAAVAICGTAADQTYLAGLPYRVRGAAGILGIDASIAAFTDGEQWLDAALGYLAGNRDLLAERLPEAVPGARLHPPEATYLAWVDCRATGLGDDPAATFLDRGRVALSDGAAFGRGGAGFVRVNFATSRTILAEITTRMSAAATALR